MKKRVGIMLAIATCFILFGCTTFSANGLSFMPMNNSATVVGHFSETKWVHEFLGNSGGGNLFNISAKAMEGPVTNLIWNEINKQGGNGAINISIKYSSHIGHWLLNWLTFKIWAPAKLKIEGDIVKVDSSANGVAQTEEAIRMALANLPENNDTVQLQD